MSEIFIGKTKFLKIKIFLPSLHTVRQSYQDFTVAGQCNMRGELKEIKA